MLKISAIILFYYHNNKENIMNYTLINSSEYAKRVKDLRARMATDGVDLVMGFSNLLEI